MNNINYLISKKDKILFKKFGFINIKQFIDNQEIINAKTAIIDFSRNVPYHINSEYNYGGSELRLWNAQLHIPEINPIYKKLKTLNKIFFEDDNEFCIMAIINKSCSKKYTDKRWHIDSFRKQNKFFLHLTDVKEGDGPFEFIPGSQSYKKRFEITIKNIIKHRTYFGINKLKLKHNYQLIHQDVIDKEKNIKRYLCQSGDLLIADVRMLHRDSPCLDGMRISLHCYLGEDISKFPNSK